MNLNGSSSVYTPQLSTISLDATVWRDHVTQIQWLPLLEKVWCLSPSSSIQISEVAIGVFLGGPCDGIAFQ